jgi:hypothetical protein
MTDFDSTMRAALHAHDAEITQESLRKPTLPAPKRSNGTSWLVAVCAAVAVAVIGSVVVLTTRTTTTPAQAIGYVGYEWRMESITKAGTTTPVPSSYGAYAKFGVDGLLLIDDSVNVSNCGYEVTPGGFSVRSRGTSAVGYGGNDPVTGLVIKAVAAVTDGTFIRALVTADQLTLTVGDYRIGYVRVAPLAAQPPPSG